MKTIMDYRSRIKILQKKLRRKKIDALLVSQPHNRRYLSGFTPHDADITESSGVLLIPGSGKGYLLTDFRYRLQAEREVNHLELVIYKRGMLATLKKLVKKLGITQLGFESGYMLYSAAAEMQSTLAKHSVHLQAQTGVIEKMRLVKDESEIAVIRQAVKLNEDVFASVYDSSLNKRSEIDIALDIECAMRRRGAERPSFDTIVASGDNSALPHAVPTTAQVEANRPLTIDMGLVLDGYCSDMTRTFVPGKTDKKYRRLHRLVRRAQLAGISKVKAGVTGKAVDLAARRVIAEAGYGKYFGHSLGHGVGLAVHEGPRVGALGKMKLKAGMVITIEPGIYIPGWGGIRLENMVVVREKGCEILNRNTTWLDI